MPPSARNDFLSALRLYPVIAAARSADDIPIAAASRVRAVFLLGGSILTLPDMAARLMDCGKYVFIHLDLCEGLGKDSAAVDWCAQAIRPHGLISTRSQCLKRASHLGMITIQRLFLVDSASLNGGIRHLMNDESDFVEVMPGLVGKAIARLRDTLSAPVIAGGMITEENEVYSALLSGASAVSTSRQALWNMEWRDFHADGKESADFSGRLGRP